MEKQKKKYKILSAEDDEDYFLLLQAILLDELQMDVFLDHVVDGEFLIAYLLNCHEEEKLGVDPKWPDLILLDLNMPRKNGFEAMREIRECNFPSIPIVILTVSNNPQDKEQSYQLGAKAFISKPSDIQELINALKSLENYWK